MDVKSENNDIPKQWDRRGLPGWCYHSPALLELEKKHIFTNLQKLSVLFSFILFTFLISYPICLVQLSRLTALFGRRILPFCLAGPFLSAILSSCFTSQFCCPALPPCSAVQSCLSVLQLFCHLLIQHALYLVCFSDFLCKQYELSSAV